MRLFSIKLTFQYKVKRGKKPHTQKKQKQGRIVQDGGYRFCHSGITSMGGVGETERRQACEPSR